MNRTPKVLASAVVPASIEDVWALVGDWAGISKWHPAVEVSSLGDGPAASQVGAIRHCTLVNGADLREIQTARSDTDHTYAYTITDGPVPMENHLGVVKLTPITDTGETFAEWSIDFDAAADVHDDIQAMFEDAIPGGLKALQAKFA